MKPILGLVLVPVLTAVLVPVAGRNGRGRRAIGTVALSGALGTFGLGLWAATAQPSLAWPWGGGLTVELAVLGFGRVMIALVPLIAAAVLAYVVAEEPDEGLVRLVTLLCAFLGAMELLVLAGDFVTLLIGFELVGACSWALIAHAWRDAENVRGAHHAFLATRLGDLGLFVAAGAAWAGAGSLSFAAVGGLPAGTLGIVAGGVLLAATAKSAQLPFSPWLFSAMRGPTPVSALLHSATMVAAGAYVLIRFAPEFAGVSWFPGAVMGIGLATALLGGIVAALHDHIKNVLAASTSAQYGLMFVAVGAGSVAAGGLHLLTHALFKALLFLGAGVAIHAAGTANLRDMRLGRALPLTAGLFGVGAAALAAIPPLGGAFSKEKVIAAAAEPGIAIALAVLFAGTLSAFYAGRLYVLAFGRGRGSPLRRPDPAALTALGTLAGLSVLAGVLWVPGVPALWDELVGAALPHGARWEIVASWTLLAAALAGAWSLGRRGRLVDLGLSSGFRAAAGDWLGLSRATEDLVVEPVTALATGLARLDDRVVDAGARAAARMGRLVSAVVATVAERGLDGLVEAVASATAAFASGSRETDDRGVDRAVEDVARTIGFGGKTARRAQTGLAHHYYVILAGGVVAAVGILLWAR